MMEILNLPGNEKVLKRLAQLVREKQLVPFLGAGFSTPACPTWGAFLETFSRELKGEGFFKSDKQEKDYQALNEREDFEAMAAMLHDIARGRRFEEAISNHIDVGIHDGMRSKFNLLHRLFTGLKITTNYDRLIEDSGPVNADIWRGHNNEELERMMVDFRRNSLLKIHGGVNDMDSIVLSAGQYETVYGHPTTFSPDALLPEALKQIFTRFSLLFIGCSLYIDRTLQVLQSVKKKQPHFAIMRMPTEREKKAGLLQHLSNFGVKQVWVSDYNQIEDILDFLCKQAGQGVCLGERELEGDAAFVGREKELKTIAEHAGTGEGGVHMITGRLFNIDGAGGVGKTTLALEIARRMAAQFKDGVIGPIRADEYTPMSFAMHLASLLGLEPSEPPDEESARARMTSLLKNRHALLVLDNAVKWRELFYMLPSRTGCTILVTTRDRSMYDRLRLKCPDLHFHKVSLERFTRTEALALFQKVLESGYEKKEEEIYLEIAESLGFLPLALRQALSLMLFGPHYSAIELRDQFAGEGRLDELRKGAAETGSDERTVETVFDLSSKILTPKLTETLEYLAICAPGPVPLDFMQRLSGNKDIRIHLEKLHTLSWCDRRQGEGGGGGKRAYELHQLVRELVRRRFGLRFRPEFVLLLHEIFTDEDGDFRIKDALMPQLEETLGLMVDGRDERLKKWVYDLRTYCSNRGYGDFFIRLSQQVEVLFPEDRWTLRAVYGHQALIFKAKGKLEEAMSLFKKEEKIKEGLDDRAGLAACYGNQATVLHLQSKLEEALNLFEKQKKIAEEFDDSAGLATCYGNQALILKSMGQLDAAMSLHKKEEKRKEELGDRAGLATCYGNQALILYHQGRLEDAMSLHKKEEKIKKELGNRAGLARSYGNQALILRAWGQVQEAMSMQKRGERICIELDDKVGLARSYGNQALIRLDLGQLDEAMRLYIRQEKIKEKLGDRAGLALSYSGQGLILSEQGQYTKAMSLFKKEEKICEELGDYIGLARTWWWQGKLHKKQGDLNTTAELWQKSANTCKSIGMPVEEMEKELRELLEEKNRRKGKG